MCLPSRPLSPGGCELPGRSWWQCAPGMGAPCGRCDLTVKIQPLPSGASLIVLQAHSVQTTQSPVHTQPHAPTHVHTHVHLSHTHSAACVTLSPGLVTGLGQGTRGRHQGQKKEHIYSVTHVWIRWQGPGQLTSLLRVRQCHPMGSKRRPPSPLPHTRARPRRRTPGGQVARCCRYSFRHPSLCRNSALGRMGPWVQEQAGVAAALEDPPPPPWERDTNNQANIYSAKWQSFRGVRAANGRMVEKLRGTETLS